MVADEGEFIQKEVLLIMAEQVPLYHSPSVDDGYIFVKYIRRNGKIIFPKKASVFKIPIKGLKRRN